MKSVRKVAAVLAALMLTAAIWERIPAPAEPTGRPTAQMRQKGFIQKEEKERPGLFAPQSDETPQNQSPKARRLRVHRAGKIQEMEMEAYIRGVVAAEMPIDFEIEALKAQAVAARTYAVHQMNQKGCSRHPGADICTDSGHCQAYASDEALKKRWGQSYAANYEKLFKAVDATQGRVMTYQGQVIEAMFHSTSGGHTEDVEQVYAQALPYLRGVESAGEEGAPKFHSEARFSRDELNRALSDYKGAHLSADRPLLDQVKILSRTPGGRVKDFQAGTARLTGTQVRRALGLNSANFTLSQQDGELLFSMTGYGHGVGMSQVGANAMAQRGKSWMEILRWYYTGVEVA
jgi:stage II sporulation protein D